MSEFRSELDADIFDATAFNDILQIATQGATATARQTVQLRHLLEQHDAADVEFGTPATTEADYLEAAQVLESVHLTERQQEVARLIVGLTAVGQQFTNASMTKMFRTRPGVVLRAVSTLTAQRDQYVPRGLRYGYRLPLLQQTIGAGGHMYYAPAEALQWCLDEPGRYPVIDEATFEATELLGQLTIDNS